MSQADEPILLVQRAQALADARRFDQALELLAGAIASDPEMVAAHALRAHCLLALKRWPEAEDAAGTAATLEPEADIVQRILSVAQLRRGRAKEARASALQAVAIDASEAANFIVLAEALQATRDEAGALTAADKAIQLAPHFAPAHDLRGRLLLAYEDPAGAEVAFRRALAINPADEGIMNNHALALARLGRRDEAVAGMEAATRLDPADELVQRNVLIVARSKHGRVVRGLGIAIGVLGVVTAGFALATWDGVVGALAAGVVLLLIGVAVFDVGVRLARRGIGGPTGQRIWDDHRARRFKPHRWDWSTVTRLRPWWWLVLERIPPPAALLLNIAVGLALPVILLGVPFSAYRAWRWYRRRHPGRGSWTPVD